MSEAKGLYWKVVISKDRVVLIESKKNQTANGKMRGTRAVCARLQTQPHYPPYSKTYYITQCHPMCRVLDKFLVRIKLTWQLYTNNPHINGCKYTLSYNQLFKPIQYESDPHLKVDFLSGIRL
jgi:hypothetical protein